jgi:hypothetical protein
VNSAPGKTEFAVTLPANSQSSHSGTQSDT